MCSPAAPFIWRLSLSPTAKLVLLALDHHRPPLPAGLCELEQTTLAAVCGLVPRQLRRVLGELRELGHIETITRRDGKGRQAANAYRITTHQDPEDMGVPWTEKPEDMDVRRTRFPIHIEIDGAPDPEDMGVRRWTQPEDMDVLRTGSGSAYFYRESSGLPSGGHERPTDPEDMGVRPSLSLRKEEVGTAIPSEENKERGDRESVGSNSRGPRSIAREPSATLSAPPGFDWLGIGEEMRPDLHQLDRVWAKFSAYNRGKVLPAVQLERHWRLWLLRERTETPGRPLGSPSRRVLGSFLGERDHSAIAGHCEVFHESV